MKKQYPTPDPRLARLRICKFVEATGKRSFSPKDVGTGVPVLRRLHDAGLLQYLEKESVESGTPVYHLPEGATAAQEVYFRKELTKIRAWSRATGQYQFAPMNVAIRGAVLEKMADNGLLGKSGQRYHIYWRSLSEQWRKR